MTGGKKTLNAKKIKQWNNSFRKIIFPGTLKLPVGTKKGLLGKHSFSKQKLDINVAKEGLSKMYELLCSGFYCKFKTPRPEYSVTGYFACMCWCYLSTAHRRTTTKKRQQPGISQEWKLERLSFTFMHLPCPAHTQ